MIPTNYTLTDYSTFQYPLPYRFPCLRCLEAISKACRLDYGSKMLERKAQQGKKRAQKKFCFRQSSNFKNFILAFTNIK